MSDIRHSGLTWRLFDAGFALFRRAFLRDTRIGGRWPDAPTDVPLLLVANHVSWWDGFLLREVQRTLRPDAPFHTVVVEHQLERHPVLRRLGGVPVDPGAPGSVRGMLRTLSRLRERDPETVFAYFPQGRIWPTSRRPLSVQRGVATVTRLLAPLRVLPVAIHIEPLVDVRPTPFLWLSDPVDVGEGDALPAAEVDHRLALGLDEIRTRLDRMGEDVVREWPDARLPAATPRVVRGGSRLTSVRSGQRADGPAPDLPGTRPTSP